MSPEKYLEQLPNVKLDDGEINQLRRLTVLQDTYDELLIDLKDMTFAEIKDLYGGLNRVVYTLISVKNEIEKLTNKLFN